MVSRPPPARAAASRAPFGSLVSRELDGVDGFGCLPFDGEGDDGVAGCCPAAGVSDGAPAVPRALPRTSVVGLSPVAVGIDSMYC